MLLKRGAQDPIYAAQCALRVGNTPLTGDSMRRIYNYELAELHMPKAPRRDPKKEALARDGALNPRPEAIRDPLFVGNPFFDPDDLLQVRYEMVRRHRVDRVGVSEVAESYGVSRPTFYKSQSALDAGGLSALLPHQRGPKGGHKISADVLAFAAGFKVDHPEATTAQCLDAIGVRFGVKAHRRSLERALARKKKDHDPA